MADETEVIKISSPLAEWIKHATDRTLSVIIIGGILLCSILAGYMVWKSFIRKDPAVQQIDKADNVITITDNRKSIMLFGCAILKPIEMPKK